MRRKLTHQVAVHLSHDDAEALKKLAYMEGISPSEYMRNLLFEHLEVKRSYYEAMSDVFSGNGTVSSLSSETVQNNQRDSDQ